MEEDIWESVINCKKHNSNGVCEICVKELFNEFETDIARLSAFGHFLVFASCFFNFKFVDAYIEIVWCISRIFKIGDYAEGGYFDKRGIKWRD